MNALNPDKSSLSYNPCRYGGARIAFRGPAKRTRGRYAAFVGSTETFGPFMPQPFPDLVEEKTGLTCINLGCRHAGIDAFLTQPGLIDLCAMAETTVIEVMGAQNMSNRFYTVDPRRNDRFLRASKQMKALFPELDFTRVETTANLLSLVARKTPERMDLLRDELQEAWTARMRSLIRAIDGRCVLLWAADHAPAEPGSGGSICRAPLFIDRAMLDDLRDEAAAIVEVVTTPQDRLAGFAEMQAGISDGAAAAELLGPVAHRRIADALAPVLAGGAEEPDFGEVTNIFAA